MRNALRVRSTRREEDRIGMPEYLLHPIGAVRRDAGTTVVEIDAAYRAALEGLSEFSHLYVVWWANKQDNPKARSICTCQPPYACGRTTGIYATRAEYRPNPIAFTVCKIVNVDATAGRVGLGNIDAFDGTPVLDLKPYYPVCDRVRHVTLPAWLPDWPDWWPEQGFGL